MESIIAFFIETGYVGMFIAALLAGSILPFSSEVVLVALQQLGLNPWELVLWGTAGNTLGSLLNYAIGRMGKPEWIGKWLRIKPDKLERGLRFSQRYGVWAGLLAWIPILGSAFTVSMGLLRTNFGLTVVTVVVGKIFRYAVLVGVVSLF